MRTATHQTTRFERGNFAGPMITLQGNTKKTMGRAALVASVLLLVFGSTASLAGKPKSFEVDFDKCLDQSIVHQGYLFTFAGQASGDVSGTVEARAVALSQGVEPDQTYIAADYVVAGTLSFTARVGGRVDDAENLAVLRGYVSDGPAWLIGAGVHDEFENYVRADGTPCSRGTLEITPRWK
jgi:hypothetical protein